MSDIPWLSDVAKQGIGFLLFAITAWLYYQKDKQLQQAQNNRVQDLQSLRDGFLSTVRDLANSQQNLQKSIDSIISILDNMRYKQ